MSVTGLNRNLPASLRFEPDRDGDGDGAVALVRLARPQKRNAIDDELVAGIDAAFAAIPESIRAVVLTSEGEHFSAGLDLSSLTASTTLQSIARSQSWYRAFERIQYGRVPVVAALRGGVIGGGFELAAAVHVRVADSTAFYALPEAQRGIFVGGGGSVRIARLIGPHRMMDLMLTGRVFDAAEGHHIGISNYLVAAGEAETRALELARAMAKIPPLSVYGIVNAVPRNAEAEPATGYLLEGLMAAAASSDPAAQGRIAEFLAGRAAKVAKPT